MHLHIFLPQDISGALGREEASNCYLLTLFSMKYYTNMKNFKFLLSPVAVTWRKPAQADASWKQISLCPRDERLDLRGGKEDQIPEIPRCKLHTPESTP